MDTPYDYPIIGGGFAGLSLVESLHEAGVTSDQRVLNIEHRKKFEKDRIWCSWQRQGLHMSGVSYKSRDNMGDPIIIQLFEIGEVRSFQKKSRLQLLDEVFPKVMHEHPELAKEIFAKLFEKSPTDDLLDFLMNQPSIIKELHIIMAMPYTGIFIRKAQEVVLG